jgi:hypothetical protein
MDFYKSSVALLCFSLMTSCARGAESAAYSMASVNPVVLSQLDGGIVQMDFKVPPETYYYVPGVDYRVDGQTLSVRIIRCSIKCRCEAMAKLLPGLPPSDGRVRIPFQGNTVVLRHLDGEQVLQAGS